MELHLGGVLLQKCFVSLPLIPGRLLNPSRLRVRHISLFATADPKPCPLILPAAQLLLQNKELRFGNHAGTEHGPDKIPVRLIGPGMPSQAFMTLGYRPLMISLAAAGADNHSVLPLLFVAPQGS